VVPIAGFLLWTLAILALIRIISLHIRNPAAKPVHIASWSLLLLLAALLLLRPHEDIFGGEDPGAYLNAAASFARLGTLFHTDPLLAQVPPSERSDFFYGHSGFASTKDACLWIHDRSKAIIGPWFQPAYSVMLSTPAQLTPRAALYGAPILGLMTALILAYLAARLISRPWAAPLTFLLYCLSPVVIWNARAPRAEMGATFFFFAGWALLLSIWENRRDRVSLNLCLALLCLAVAPLFHITAWYGVIATFAILLATALQGRRDFLLVIPVALLAVTSLILQSFTITDCYTLKPHFEALLSRLWIVGPLALIASAICVWRSFRAHSNPIPSPLRWPALIFAFGIPLLILAVALLRNDLGRIPFLPAATAPYIILTDIQGLIRLYSLPATLAALIGWILLALPRTATPGAFPRWIFLAAMTPGILMTGWMDNYMMETRRLMIVPAPIMSLCLAALICLAASAAQRLRWKFATPLLATLLTLAILGSMMAHKAILYRTTEYRGLHRFLKPFANEIRHNNGILLAEYSRVAAPFEHFFGIPLLALDSDRRNDYRRAEKSWLNIILNSPNHPAYFLSPYANPVSAFFDFTPVMEKQYSGKKLSGSKRAIPSSSRQYSLTLHLFRITPKGTRPPPASFTRTFDGGNMGLSRFANLLVKPMAINGYPVPQTNALALTIPPLPSAPSLFLFAYVTPPSTPSLPLRLPPSTHASLSWFPLTDGWWVAETPIPAETTTLLLRSESGNAFLATILARQGDSTVPLALSAATPPVTQVLPPGNARWARDHATVLTPVPAGTTSTAYCLVTLNPNQPAASCIMESIIGDNNPAGRREQELMLTPGEWTWRVIPVSGGSNHLARISFHAGTPWNPNRRGFPRDLAVQVGAIVTRPTSIP
jgi:hypothetical protein